VRFCVGAGGTTCLRLLTFTNSFANHVWAWKPQCACFFLLILSIRSSGGQVWGTQVGQCTGCSLQTAWCWSQPYTLAKGFSVLLKTKYLCKPELEGKVSGPWSYQATAPPLPRLPNMGGQLEGRGNLHILDFFPLDSLHAIHHQQA